jgi:hypothetical protein
MNGVSMEPESPETPKAADVDPNDWDMKESVLDFIHRENIRLSPKVPAEFEATGFRISFIATTDKRKHPVEWYFTVAMRVMEIGEVRLMGRNPSEITIRLIDAVYKEYAKLAHKRNEQQRYDRQRRNAEARLHAAAQSLFNYAPQEIADMVDGVSTLPEDVTIEMVLERSRKIAIETVRELDDRGLEQGNAPSFLSEAEQQNFKVRCESEIRCRSRVRELFEVHRHLWQEVDDAYTMVLQIWKLCNRQATVLDDVITDFFYMSPTPSGSTPTLGSLYPIAPQWIKKVRRDKALAKIEAERPERERREVEYHQRQAEFQASGGWDGFWSKMRPPI